MVGPPKVINKKVDDKLFEPFEVMLIISDCSSHLQSKKNERAVTLVVDLRAHL